MFEKTRIIRLGDTDATGSLYFTNQLKFSVELFEVFLEEKYTPLSTQIYQEDILFPIVEAKSQYLERVKVNDNLILTLTFAQIGRASFSIHTTIKKGDQLVGTTQITHVCVSKITNKSTPIPNVFRTLIESDGKHLTVS